MKSGVRYIAIASGPIGNKKRAILIGVIFRNNYIEGLLSSSIGVDGTDSTRSIIRMVKGSRFGGQVRILLLNGIALAGLNVIEPDTLERKLKSKVVILNRRKQNPKELIRALREFSRLTKTDVSKRAETVRKYGLVKPERARGLYIQSRMEAAYIRGFADRWFEAARIAHIVARGISSGESRGRI